MRVRMLGESVIELRDREFTPAAPHFFALLLRLSADAGRLFQRQELAHLLFPQAPSERAATHSVRQLLYQATQRGAPIEKSGGAVSIRESDLSLDVEEALRTDQSHENTRLRALTILPGYAPTLSDGFTEWLDSYRQHQQARVRHVLVAAIEALRRRADWRSLEARAMECLALDPFSETATLALAEALARMGSKERAVALLDNYRKEVGDCDSLIALPASLLRKRIEASSLVALSIRGQLLERGDSLSLLHDQWCQARAGQLKYTIIRGEPGVGKSRLLEDFTETLRLSGRSSAITVRKSSAERFRPFAFFADLASQVMHLPGSAGCEPRLLPFLTRLSGGFSCEPSELANPGEAQFISAGIQRALVDLLESVGNERSLVIIVDDSRAIDDVSLALLADIPTLSPRLPLHLVVVCDDSDHRDGLAALAAHHIQLRPLSRRASRQLVVDLLGAVQSVLSPPTIEWCLNVGAGNPAFLHLLVAQSNSASHALDIPKDILAAVDKRLAALSTHAARVLEACAVLGDHCDSIMLAEVIGLPAFSLLSALHELERFGFIDCNGEQIDLRSALFRDRIILSASRAVLSLLHSRSAIALERLDSSANSSWRIAAHWHYAGQHNRARATLSALWRRSILLGQPQHAEEGIREYLTLTRDAEERITLYNDLIAVTQAAGDPTATIRAIDERTALVSSSRISDDRSETMAFDRLDAQLQNQADPSTPQRELLQYMRSEVLDNSRRLRAAQRLLASADATAGKDLADEVFHALLSIERPDPSARLQFEQALLIYHSIFGDKERALCIARHTLGSIAETPQSLLSIRARVNASLALRLTSDTDEAIVHLQSTYEAVCAAGATNVCAQVASRLASCFIDDGALSSALAWIHHAELHVNTRAIGRLPAEYLSVKADLAIISGDLSTAGDLVATMRDKSPLYQAPRYRMELVSYSMRLEQYADRRAAASDVEALLAWHYLARSHGRHDDNMDTLWVALVHQGRESLASTLLEDYLRHHRRETRPCGYFLRSRTASDPVWEKTSHTASLGT